MNPLARGLDLANRVLAAVNDEPPPPRTFGAPGALGALVAWVDIERDRRGVDIYISVDSLSGDPVYAVAAHDVAGPIESWHGSGRTLQSAAGACLANIRQPPSQEEPPCP